MHGAVAAAAEVAATAAAAVPGADDLVAWDEGWQHFQGGIVREALLATASMGCQLVSMLGGLRSLEQPVEWARAFSLHRQQQRCAGTDTVYMKYDQSLSGLHTKQCVLGAQSLLSLFIEDIKYSA